MDIFIEYMVKKKKGMQDYLLMFGISLFGVAALFLVFVILMSIIPQIASIILLLVVGGFYGIYRLITSFNLEYEYSLVNSEMDVDKIINVRKRKRLTTVNLKGLEAFGTIGGSRSEYESYLRKANVEKIFACIDKNDDSACFAVYNEKEHQKMLVFNPNDKMVDRIKKLNPFKTMQL